MFKSNVYWFAAISCVFGFACDDDSPADNRVPQIEIGGDSAAGDEPPVNAEVCERTFVFTERDSRPQSVKLAGTFESPPWSGSIELLDEDGDGQWIVSTPVSVGEHQYKWIIDGEWRADLDHPSTVDDGSGGVNSAIAHQCPFNPECTLHADCDEDLLCLGLSCRSDGLPALCERCPESCDVSTGECQGAPEAECDEERPCASPLVCIAGQCVPECQEDQDCRSTDSEALCVDFECVVPECQVDDECDLLEESCASYRCAPRPCSEYLFLFDPMGENYDSVHVAGDFNATADGQWPSSISAGGWAMTRLPDGRYYTRQVIENGSYAYKIVLTRGESVEWIADPLATTLVDDGFGGQNSLLEQSWKTSPPPWARGDLGTFQWEDAVMYFAMVDRFYDSDGQSIPVPMSQEERRLKVRQYEGGDLPCH